MKRIAWLTDLHWSFVEPEIRQRFLDELAATEADALLIGGDIGESHNVVSFLQELVNVFELPTYVVLGNHDFYGSGVRPVRRKVEQLSQQLPNLHYLTTACSPIRLSQRTGLIGHDGWADGRESDYHHSRVLLNDYRLIDDLAPLSKPDRLRELCRLGDEAAEHIRTQLGMALPIYEEVLLLTHVPPFREACWHQGQISDDQWAPHFVCQAMGRIILDVASKSPETQITVLCGHTHSSGTCDPAPNVHVITGAAEYGAPEITQVFELN